MLICPTRIYHFNESKLLEKNIFLHHASPSLDNDLSNIIKSGVSFQLHVPIDTVNSNNTEWQLTFIIYIMYVNNI